MGNSSKIPFSQKIKQQKRAILYEVVPPPKNTGCSDIEKSMSLIAVLLHKLSVDAVNIPEVRPEKRNGVRNSQVPERLEPRDLCNYLHCEGFRDVIINRPVVYLPWANQKKWLKQTYDDYKIRNYIFVGGESSKVNYPGISVEEAANKVTQTYKQDFPDILLGGITIPTRKNEALRLLKKSLSGINFFTTQIIYESDSIKQLLNDYWKLCLKNRIEAKMICLSFAPVTSVKDIELLSWLGVKISQKTVGELTGGWLGMGWRSLRVCQDVLKDVFQFMFKRHIRVPIGLNIGYINRYKFEFSIAFLEQLGVLYKKKYNL